MRQLLADLAASMAGPQAILLLSGLTVVRPEPLPPSWLRKTRLHIPRCAAGDFSFIGSGENNVTGIHGRRPTLRRDYVVVAGEDNIAGGLGLIGRRRVLRTKPLEIVLRSWLGEDINDFHE